MARANKKETVQFSQSVSAGTDATYTYRIKGQATIQRIFGKFYAGQERDLQVRPQLNRTGGRYEDLITYPTGARQYMAGDDTAFDIYIDIDCVVDDEISVYVNNVSDYDYDLDISFEVDYVGGGGRVL